MGLLLSVLVGCVGVLELLTCLNRASDRSIIRIDPPTTCLSYHDRPKGGFTAHDSLCGIGHSKDLDLSSGAKYKLENLHEYSLRIRSEIRSIDPTFDANTLSDCSTADLLTKSESKLFDPDFERLFHEVNERTEVTAATFAEQSEGYFNVPTPISNFTSTELLNNESEIFFDENLLEKRITTKSFDVSPIRDTARYEENSSSSGNESDDEDASILRRPILKSKSPDVSTKSDYIDLAESEIEVDKHQQSLKKSKIKQSTSTIVRKATRLKSKNTEISKSAENLSTKRSKRLREPERRKSDISVQTVRDLLKDEWTNTSPPGSPSLSRSESKRSVSVEVQTSFDEKSFVEELETEEFQVENHPVLGLSESKRDYDSREKRAKSSFKRRRFKSTSTETTSTEDCPDSHVAERAITSVEKSYKQDQSSSLKISTFEDARRDDYERVRDIILESESTTQKDDRGRGNKEKTILFVKSMSSFEDDEEYVSAEDVSSTHGKGHIEYTTPDTDRNKAFWLIFSGEYTKAMNKDWHSGHFCCWQCDESLTGQRYVLRDEHPYCIKCYESVFANGCEECNKIIGIDSKDLSYKDKHWHEACFLCNRCRVSLVDKQFGSKVDKIYCGNCYDAQFASRCDGCGEIFRAGTKKMEYKTRQWHEKCFCCVVCKNPIGTKSFIPREQEIYCAGCYEDKFATRCVKCNKIITSGGVTYKNEPWHRDCFTCSNCNNSLAGQRFTSRDDKPYCADCFGELFAKRCTACSKPITGIGGTRFISFEDRHWHNECFICAGCKTSLVGRGFITDGDDIICPECAKAKLM
ncbi:PREDICTED: zinc finger protein 184 isoform X1 [Polistes dominula]|uniref:Zinc finger protein 184 isoform X1 n=1 Tax=Polistes dominula TaxID=743375 RepID=A0ABM1JF54_POLDO|nr:PREDICTED: zinc finger protein 184 isoform X1 [Polistes dominula]